LDPQPYGSLLPGAVVTFSTTDRNGREERNTEWREGKKATCVKYTHADH